MLPHTSVQSATVRVCLLQRQDSQTGGEGHISLLHSTNTCQSPALSRCWGSVVNKTKPPSSLRFHAGGGATIDVISNSPKIQGQGYNLQSFPESAGILSKIRKAMIQGQEREYHPTTHPNPVPRSWDTKTKMIQDYQVSKRWRRKEQPDLAILGGTFIELLQPLPPL